MDWIAEYLAYEEGRLFAHRARRLAKVIYPSAWGDGRQWSALQWAEKGLRAVLR